MKTVFITGATENTGYAIAQKFAENKYNVAISSRNPEKAQIAAKKLKKIMELKQKDMVLT